MSAGEGEDVVCGMLEKNGLPEDGDGKADSGAGLLRRFFEEKEWLFAGRTEVMVK